MLLAPQHWLERAKTARLTAQFIGDPEARRLLLKIAEIYEKIAARARLTANER